MTEQYVVIEKDKLNPKDQGDPIGTFRSWERACKEVDAIRAGWTPRLKLQYGHEIKPLGVMR